MQRSLLLVCGLLGALPSGIYAGDHPLRDQAAQALRRATEFFRTRVATEGGYLWRYSEDLSKREGEGRASPTTIWVQPPGTPTIGMAYLDASEATGDRSYLEAAREAAEALLRGQLRSGGWDYRIEFDPRQRRQYAYRVDGSRAGSQNVTTLDDDTTQSALRFLMRLDRALDFQDERLHESITYALTSLIGAQYPNGAWPQRFNRPADPAGPPAQQADYPDSWSRKFPGQKYAGHYTLNDGAIPDTIATMLEAARIYGEKRFRDSALRAGEFLLLAQMPEPQPGWAQQYDENMHPAWARRFEPPAITSSESQSVMRTLLLLYRETGDHKYLAPLPRAIAYFRRSRLPDGQLARFYELKTNRPLYCTRDYELTYSDADVPTHYSFKVPDRLDRIEREYEQLRKMEPARLAATARPGKPRITPALEERVRSIIAALDDRGRWVEKGRLRYHGKDDDTRRVIECQTFARNVEILSEYLSAARSNP